MLGHTVIDTYLARPDDRDVSLEEGGGLLGLLIDELLLTPQLRQLAVIVCIIVLLHTHLSNDLHEERLQMTHPNVTQSTLSPWSPYCKEAWSRSDESILTEEKSYARVNTIPQVHRGVHGVPDLVGQRADGLLEGLKGSILAGGFQRLCHSEGP